MKRLIKKSDAFDQSPVLQNQPLQSTQLSQTQPSQQLPQQPVNHTLNDMPLDKANNEKQKKEHPNGSMVEMGLLEEADVRHDRCPICDDEGAMLNMVDGFKKCDSCGSSFKLLDGRAFVVV